MSSPAEKSGLPEIPEPPAIAAKANDLEALRSAVADAAGVSAGLWLSYLLVLFYLLIAAGGVTHRDLFFANAVKLPFLNVELPVTGFFWLGPALFLIMHTYVLLHFVLLASKISVFNAQLCAQIDDAILRAQLRRQLPINIFVQYLAGPSEVRRGIIGSLLRLIAWISLVIGPVAVLAFFELQFVAYHHVLISWWQRVAVFIDLLVLWTLWPSLQSGEERAWRRIGWGTGSALVCISFVAILVVMVIGTFPGESLEKALGNRRSLWPNRLMLPGLDTVDHAKFDNEAKIAAAPKPFILNGRNLDGAVLIGADLRAVNFGQISLKGADLTGARLQGASLRGAQLQGALFGFAQLQGASLAEAQLQGARFDGAQLQGASLYRAKLQGASLDGAKLRGASLDGANLQSASLEFSNLEGASLVGAQLQGASLKEAQLSLASISDAFVWRADVTLASGQGTWIRSLEPGRKSFCSESPAPLHAVSLPVPVPGLICDWTVDSFKRLQAEIPDDMPTYLDRPGAASRRLQQLNPNESFAGETQIAEIWAQLAHGSPAAPEVYGAVLVELLRGIGCSTVGAPFVLEGLVNQIATQELRSGFDKALVYQLASDFLKEDCAGARGMSEGIRATLSRLRDESAPGAARKIEAFWRPNGVVDPANDAKIKACMSKYNLTGSIAFLINARSDAEKNLVISCLQL